MLCLFLYNTKTQKLCLSEVCFFKCWNQYGWTSIPNSEYKLMDHKPCRVVELQLVNSVQTKWSVWTKVVSDNLSIFLTVYLSFYLSFYLFFYQSFSQSFCLPSISYYLFSTHVSLTPEHFDLSVQVTIQRILCCAAVVTGRLKWQYGHSNYWAIWFTSTH